ncbi:unnamed protein product [Thlaspi arvense]|uniref:Uncharacterized protein n=1 Tax=Thlaspi arvense TaxID=13288 RepID=A0AAU9T7Y9_THLAR|nr:unnamed protein product [Thlaspi arvense]
MKRKNPMAPVLTLPAISSNLVPFVPQNHELPSLHRRRKKPIPSLSRSSLADHSLSAKRRLLDLISDQDRVSRRRAIPRSFPRSSMPLTPWASWAETLSPPDNRCPPRGDYSGPQRRSSFSSSRMRFSSEPEPGKLNNVITFPPHGVFFVRSNIDIASPQRVNFSFTWGELGASVTSIRAGLFSIVLSYYGRLSAFLL